MSSDETYLESFIESLSTLPHEVRRNLDLIKDLDQTCRYVSYWKRMDMYEQSATQGNSEHLGGYTVVHR
jgi:hypothetical protein